MTADEYLNSALGKSEGVMSADDFLNQQLGESVSPAQPERRAGGGITGGAADVGVQFMKGLGTGTRMISDVFGANNPVSQAIAGYEDYMDSLLSAESKQDSQEISRILKDAEGKGILPQIMAGLEAFTVAPAEMTATTMGMMLPNLAGGVYAKAAQLTKAGVLGLQMGIGAAQGMGSVKGQIYTAVQEELRQQGLPEDQIDKVATEAQAYNGKNLDQILIGAGLGAAASSTGAEKIMTRLITGAGKEATEDIIKATIKGGLSEAPIEALQGGQAKIAENVALQGIGVDVPTMQGVIPAATMEATAGLLIGGGLGGVEAFVSPEKKEEDDIDKKAQQTANEFLAPNDPTSQAIVKELARRENAVKNLQEAYDVLEPTSQEAQKLKLELGDAQRKLSAYKEIANKAGLSLPITTAEQQQIELAKQISAPAKKEAKLPAMPSIEEQTSEAAYGRELGVYDVFGAATRRPAKLPKEIARPTIPSIAEQEAGLVYGGETGVYDVFGGVRRKPAPPTTEAPAITPAPTPTEPATTEDIIGKKVTDSMGALPQKAGKARQALQGYIPVFKIGDFYEFIGEDAALSGSTIVGSGKSARSSLPYHQTSKFQEIANKTGKPIAIISNTKVSEVINPITPAPVAETPAVIPAPAVSEPTTPVEAAGKAEAIKFADEALRERDKEVGRYKKKADSERKAGREEMAQIYEGMIDDLMSVPANEFKQDVIENPAYYIESNVDPFLRFKNKEINRAAPLTPSKRKREAGGVLIPSREDLIQSGQNIYEAGMEFATWAKQMVQRFGDAVRQFLADVWEAVSGFPAKLEEMAGYLPGKGERGAVTFGRGEEPKNMDADYLAAVEEAKKTGDFTNVQRMVDEAAKEAGYRSPKVYHGTQAKFNVFDESKIGSANGRSEGSGFYFTTDQSIAEGYQRNGGNIISAYLNVKKPLDYNQKPFSALQIKKLLKAVALTEAKDSFDGNWKDGFLANYGDTYSKSIDSIVAEAATYFTNEESALDQIGGIIGSGVDPSTVNTALTSSLGYDAFFSKGFSGEGNKGGDIYVAMRSDQIKSADPVTYDDAGDIIPLEERFQPTSPDIRRQAIDTTPEGILITPPDQQYTFEEVFDVAYDMFGGEIPEGFTIVNDSKDKDFEFKAAYVPESGEIIVNLAYLNRNDDIRDAITHELGHYIYGDPEFRAAFDQFIASLSPEARAELDAYVDTAYNKETGEIRLEEKMVRAFVDQFINEEQAPAWRSMLDAIKRFLNKLGFKFNISDRDAISVFTAALDRYKAGEAISREGGARKIIDDLTAMDAEYLAAVERGDMETAQRMVNEAAKKAGYDTFATHRTNAKFTVFDANKINKRDSGFIGDGFYFSPGGISQSNEGYGRNAYEVYLSGKFLDLNPRTADIDKIQQAVIDQVNEKRVSKGLEKLKTTDTQYQRIVNDFKMDTAMAESGIGAIASAIKKSSYVSTIAKRMGFDGAFEKNEIVVFDPSQIKSADPVTYDDAGDVIPLSQRFRPTSPDIRRMAAEPKKEQPEPEKPAGEKPKMERYKGKAQVAGVPGIGAEKDTPKGINKKTEEIIKDRVFDAAIVNDNQTKKAWNLIQKIEEKNPESGKNAQAINELTRETMQDVEADEVVKQSIGAVKLRNELYSYAIKLAGEGDDKMLKYLLNTRLSLGSGSILEGDDGRRMQAMASLKSWIVRATEAEQAGFFDIAAQQFFGTKTPTDEQVQQIKDIFNKVKEVKIDQEKELMDELEEVGKAAGVDLPAAVDKQLENTPGLDPMVVAITNMLKMGGTFTYRPTKNKIGEAVKNTINRGITNYRKKIVSKAANGLETGFWKTLSSTEQKLGPLGELDSAQNRALGNIVKQALVDMKLQGTPPNTKMSIYEQVASILGEQPLSQDKIKMADEKIRSTIKDKRQAELDNATEDQKDAINLKYDEMTFAWDNAMSRSLDMPVSDTMLRRMILNELKEADTSIQDIAKLMDEEPVIGASRQDRLVNSIIEKVTGITFEGQLTRDYTNLKTYLSDLLENMVLARQQKNKAAKDVAKTKRDASGDPTKQAQAQIDKLAKIQADPTIFGEKRIDPVRNAVRDALSLQLNIGFTPEQSAKIKNNWKGAFVADPNKKGIPTSFMLELQRLGVSEAAANTLADIVWRQIEVNAMSRQMDATTKAVEAGTIGGIVQSILDTPLANQQDPEWRKNVILDYLKNAGVKPSQAENIAKLFDVSLRKRFAKAQEEAAIKAAKSIKGGLTANSKRAFEKFLKAIRAQVLDPGKDVAKAFAEEMGWKGFTAEQIARLNELDAIVNDTNRTDAEIFTATEQIQKIIDKVSAPPQIKNVLSSFYVGQALLRFTTFAIQGFDPLVFTGVNTAIRSLKNVTSPTQFIQAWADYGTAISNFFRETAYSFKNDTGRSGRMIDYLENEDRKQKRLLNEAVKKFEQGNIPGAMKDAIFGYTAFTFRTLKALDDGAYSLLTSTTLPQYVEAALKNAKIPREKRKGVMRQILKARKLDIDQMVEQGIAKNDAVIYANERMQSAITKELSGLNIDSQEVINSAINDALSRIGKTRFVEDILTGKIEEIKDTGFLSSPFISFYEWAAKAANATEKESQKILYRIMFGFPLIAGRVFNAAAGYTPITLYRHFLNKDRYQLTYGTALQRRQRFIEQMAGTMVLLPLFLMRSNSLDDEEKKKRGFSIYVTGQGPSKLKDKTLHAKWNDAHKPFSMEFDFGKKGKFSIDAKSAGPFSVMIYTLGALDDWEINRKLNDLKTTKNDWREAEAKASLFSTLYEIGGYMLITTARRGPTTGLMQGLVDWRRYPDDPIAAIGAEISFSALPAVPILGAGALKNLSDFFSQPIDNTTKEGAILANIPIVGPIAGKPALNAYGQKIGELRFSEKLKKSFGVPFTLVVSDNEEDNKLTSLTLKFGDGPTPLRREDVENELKSAISDDEWYLAAKTFGDRNRSYVLKNYGRYEKMKPAGFSKVMSALGKASKANAIAAVKKARRNNP